MTEWRGLGGGGVRGDRKEHKLIKKTANCEPQLYLVIQNRHFTWIAQQDFRRLMWRLTQSSPASLSGITFLRGNNSDAESPLPVEKQKAPLPP